MPQLQLKVGYELLTEAIPYLHLYHYEHGTSSTFQERLTVVQAEIEQRGTYWQTYDEVLYGARVAWRNSTRCIGRLPWKSLQICDMRHLATAEDIFEALVEHLRLGTNGGKIKPLMTVFAPQEPGQPGLRIWNPQLIRYAGYRQADGSVIGDPAHVELTEIVQRLGWNGAEGTPFDILPLVIQMPHEHPKLFDIPRDAVLEVPIMHPEYPWFAELGLKWHALPTIANMRMEIGGVSYTAAPFNGWYMGTEIGARNLGDVNRYNMLPEIAERMGLDMSSERTLWRDRALVELNRAVLYSFTEQGVMIVDHHTASQQFVCHEEREKKCGRSTYGDWGWIVPPISGSTTPVFHRSYDDVLLKPNFFYQPTLQLEALQGKISRCPLGHYEAQSA